MNFKKKPQPDNLLKTGNGIMSQGPEVDGNTRHPPRVRADNYSLRSGAPRDALALEEPLRGSSTKTRPHSRYGLRGPADKRPPFLEV